VYIRPQTTATTTCRRHNHASRAEQDHNEPILASSPDPFAVRQTIRISTIRAEQHPHTIIPNPT
jgi:hypothetical protein